jgi:putative endonuclease
MAGYYCYILECADGTYYTGWTTDPERRVRQHNSGRGARYTRARRPVRLAYSEPQPDRASAMRRELRIKQCSHAEKLALAGNRVEAVIGADEANTLTVEDSHEHC